MSDYSSLSSLTESQITEVLVENGRALRNKELEVQPFLEEVRRIDEEYSRDLYDLKEAYEPKISSLENELDQLDKGVSEDQFEIHNLTQILLNMKDEMKSKMIELVQRVSQDEIQYWQNQEENIRKSTAEEEETAKLLTKKALETSAALSILNPKFEEQVSKANKTLKVLDGMLNSLQHQFSTSQMELESLKRVSAEKSSMLQRLREETAQYSSAVTEATEALSFCTPILADRLQAYTSGDVGLERRELPFTSNRYSNKFASVVNIFDGDLVDQLRIMSRISDGLGALDGQISAIQSKISVLQQALKDAVSRPHQHMGGMN